MGRKAKKTEAAPPAAPVTFEQLTKWASDSEFVLEQRAMAAINEVCDQGDVKLRLYLMVAARQRTRALAKMMDRFEKVGDLLFTEENLKGMAIDPLNLARIYALLSKDVYRHTELLREEVVRPERVTPDQVHKAFAGEPTSTSSKTISTMPPESREMIRSMLSALHRETRTTARGALQPAPVAVSPPEVMVEPPPPAPTGDGPLVAPPSL